jgi:DMSO/TMAO reductase YedYZ molybdopterin-dependent catalytic subunit
MLDQGPDPSGSIAFDHERLVVDGAIYIGLLTTLAYELNDEPLPSKNGAPLRLRLERQLGYKMAKYVMRMRIVDDFSGIAGGKGGYWEDQGYAWHAGI